MINNKELNKIIMNNEYLVLSCIKRLRIYQNYEDFYQVGMMALYKAIRVYEINLDLSKNFGVYAYYIILNHMKNEIKRLKRLLSLEELIDLYHHQASCYVFEDNIANKIELEYLLRTLTEDEREIIELKKLGMKNSEIANELNLNVEQVKYKVKNIIKKIRNRMKM